MDQQVNETDRETEAGAEEDASFNANATYHEVVFSDKWLALRDAAYQDYRDQWTSVPEQKLELAFPLHLDIETTNICNLLCPMCPRTSLYLDAGKEMLQEMTREEYSDIIDQGLKHGLKSIKLNYLGEPMAHKDLVWQVRYAKEQGVVDVMMNSNATLLTKILGKALLEAGLDKLFVSFDAISPRDYEIQRKGTTIGKVIDNVFNFVNLRNEHRPSCQIRLSMVMYDTEYWHRQFEGLKIMWDGMVDAIGYGFYTERDPSKMDEYPEVEGFHCSQPFQRMFIKINGNVTVCCVDDKDEILMGNWRETPLQDIWQGEKYKAFRKSQAEGKYYDNALCRKCYLPVSA